jgi:hypothetical protein
MFFYNNRNTNYFGEIMLYSSFAFLVNRWEAFAILFSIWFTVFFGRMYQKEMSLRKKDGYEKYGNRSYMVLFKIFSSDALNAALYAGIVLVILMIYNAGGIQKFLFKN